MSRDRLRLIVQDVSQFPGTPGKRALERWARRAFADSGGELVVRIVGEAESAQLNERYRGKPGATNVLAFAAGEWPAAADEPAPLGDIVICAPVVAREAEAQGKPAEDHWAHMLVHGCLHLQGYDHGKPAEARAMEARERELLAALGIGDPYLASPPG